MLVWLGAALASPLFRALLLDRHVDTLAVARSVDAKANVENVAFVGFELFEAREYPDEESAFMDTIDAQRASRGKPPIERVGGATGIRTRTGDDGCDELVVDLASGTARSVEVPA